jgi:hypothetical protein
LELEPTIVATSKDIKQRRTLKVNSQVLYRRKRQLSNFKEIHFEHFNFQTSPSEVHLITPQGTCDRIQRTTLPQSRAIGTWRRRRRVLLIAAFTSPPRKLILSFNKLLMPQEYYSTKFRRIFLLNYEFGLTQAKFPIKLAKRGQSLCFIEETNLARKNSDTIW